MLSVLIILLICQHHRSFILLLCLFFEGDNQELSKQLTDYVQDKSDNIDFVSFIFDILESDPKYSRGMNEEKRKQRREILENRAEGQAWNFPLKDFAVDVIQFADIKKDGMLTTAFNVGKGKEVSFFGALRSKEGKITPKKKFLSSDIVGVLVDGSGIPGFPEIEADEKLKQDIQKLFQTKLVDIFGVMYVKDQRLALQTKVSRNISKIRAANLSDDEYVESTKLLVDVFVRIGTHLRKPHSEVHHD